MLNLKKPIYADWNNNNDIEIEAILVRCGGMAIYIVICNLGETVKAIQFTVFRVNKICVNVNS